MTATTRVEPDGCVTIVDCSPAVESAKLSGKSHESEPAKSDGTSTGVNSLSLPVRTPPSTWARPRAFSTEGAGVDGTCLISYCR